MLSGHEDKRLEAKAKKAENEYPIRSLFHMIYADVGRILMSQDEARMNAFLSQI